MSTRSSAGRFRAAAKRPSPPWPTPAPRRRPLGRPRVGTLIAPILSERLELRSLSPRFIEALLSGRRSEAEAILHAPVPPEWPADVDHMLRLRLEQMQRDPGEQEWLAR